MLTLPFRDLNGVTSANSPFESLFNPIIFYLEQIKLNFGISGLLFIAVGFMKNNKTYDLYLLVFFLLYLFTISNWIFFNARYLLILYPILIYKILKGIIFVKVLLSKRIKNNNQVEYLFILIIISEQLNNYFTW